MSKFIYSTIIFEKKSDSYVEDLKKVVFLFIETIVKTECEKSNRSSGNAKKRREHISRSKPGNKMLPECIFSRSYCF